MHATIDVRFTISIDEGKTVPLATFAEFVTEQNVESVLLESMVKCLDASRVEALCGEKHATGNGDRRFQRAGTDTRTAVTTAGDHEFDFHYVEDTAADHGDGILSEMPSPTTINHRAREYGSKLEQFLPDCIANTDADGTVLRRDPLFRTQERAVGTA